MPAIPIIIAAHNEEISIRRCISSIQESIQHCSLGLEFEIIVGADRCHDRTSSIAHSMNVQVLETSGGKVETQRQCLQNAPFLIFIDADVYITPQTIQGLCETMTSSPNVHVAYPPKTPLRPRSRSWIARAAYHYAKEEGFRKKRYWFDGKCFAIRHWNIPHTKELQTRIQKLPEDNFYDYHKGVLIDDVYLSRLMLHEYGVDSMQKSDTGMLYFRNPESLGAMYSYYRRVRRELERIDLLFPEMLESMRVLEAPQISWEKFSNSSLRAQVSYFLFKIVDHSFSPVYTLERFYFQNLSHKEAEDWPTIHETKG